MQAASPGLTRSDSSSSGQFGSTRDLHALAPSDDDDFAESSGAFPAHSSSPAPAADRVSRDADDTPTTGIRTEVTSRPPLPSIRAIDERLFETLHRPAAAEFQNIPLIGGIFKRVPHLGSGVTQGQVAIFNGTIMPALSRTLLGGPIAATAVNALGMGLGSIGLFTAANPAPAAVRALHVDVEKLREPKPGEPELNLEARQLLCEEAPGLAENIDAYAKLRAGHVVETAFPHNASPAALRRRLRALEPKPADEPLPAKPPVTAVNELEGWELLDFDPSTRTRRELRSVEGILKHTTPHTPTNLRTAPEIAMWNALKPHVARRDVLEAARSYDAYQARDARPREAFYLDAVGARYPEVKKHFDVRP